MLSRKNLRALNVIVIAGVVMVFILFLIAREKVLAENFELEKGTKENSIMEENTFLGNYPVPSFGEQDVSRRINVIITAYSSTPMETDATPFITASGELVRNGIVANNLLPFGTKIRIPKLYGDQIFEVTDRMHSRKGFYHVDIWQDSREKALEFGAKFATVEVLD